MERGDLVAGRYRLDAKIGSGATGEVWRATDQGSNAAVALRWVRLAHLAPDARERARGRLRAEAGVASRLRHPNIASMHGLVEHYGEPWLITKYVPAPNLAELMAAGPLPPHRAAGIGAQVASALAYAHSSAPGVVHRAVTPRAVLVGGGDHVSLDFGIATTEGVAAYLAPEVANGLGGGPQADVFSLGATLYAAVEGRPPWGDGNLAQTRTVAMKGVVDPPRRAGALGPVLMRMLDSRPGQRPTAAEAAQLLMEVVRSERTGERGEPTSGRGARTGRRRLWITVAAVAVVVVAAVGLVVWPRSGPVLDDPVTADPCSLIQRESFDRFGRPHLETDDGNFDRCDVNIDSGPDRFAARVQFVLASAVPPEGVPEERDGMVIVRGTPVNGECVRTLRLSDGNDVRVVAQPVQGSLPDPCAVADVATETALAVLVSGPVPRRPAPFAPGSLAMVDACGLLDAPTVAKVPSLEAIPPDPGFGGWSCDWENVATGASVAVSYDRNKGISRSAGNRMQIAGRDAAARADQDGAGCDVTVQHRAYTDPSGSPADELLIVKADQATPVADPCAQAVAIATVAVEHLPAMP